MSMDVVLTMLALGAQGGTLVELLRILGCADVGELKANARKLADVVESSDDEGDNRVKVCSVNGVWFDKRFGLNDLFRKVLRDVCRASATTVDFVNQGDKVVKEVNKWAKEETKGLIKRLISTDDISGYTRVLLTNALHFQATWQYPFETIYTTFKPFTLATGDSVKVPFLNQFNEYYGYATLNDCQVLRMPYIGSDPSTKSFSMYIFLPNEVTGLADLVNGIDTGGSLIRDKVEFRNIEITELAIPKLKLESSVSLKESMKQLGLMSPFDENCKDLSGMIDEHVSESVYVSDVIQKGCVEFNERGTAAGAVTWSDETLACAPPSEEPTFFLAHHPFMFMIREDVSGVLLFVGTVLDPR
ncbi:hypothetical protein vseg_015317 [Gypsophila vaccaria]